MKSATRTFEMRDLRSVISLWDRCRLARPYNDSEKDVERMLSAQGGGFLVVEDEREQIIGTVMFGYDGHRGNVYYLCVDPGHQGAGIGTQLMREVENAFVRMGALKSTSWSGRRILTLPAFINHWVLFTKKSCALERDCFMTD